MSKKSTDIGVGKKVLASALSAAMVVAFAPAVGTAVGSDDAVAYAEESATATTLTINDVQDGQITISVSGSYRLGESLTANIVVASGVSADIDLGGFTLTNAGNGKATLSVQGTANVHDGSVIGGDSYYNIEVPEGSNGNLTISDVIATTDNTGSSMIDNWGTMEIKSGSYTGGLNVVKSEPNASLTINGGKFELSFATSSGVNGVILNYGTATINQGEFLVNMTSAKGNPQVVVTGKETEASPDPLTTVNGGTFTIKKGGTSSKILHRLLKASYENIELNGGSFSTNKYMSNYLKTGYSLSKSGSFYVCTKNVTSLTLNCESERMCVGGDNLRLSTTAGPDDVAVKDVTWKSSDTKIALVDRSTGEVTAKAVGTTTITATAVAGGLTASCVVTVGEGVAEIGEKPYASLQAAIDAAQQGDTVKLLNNVTIDKTVDVSKKLSIDLAGNTITGSATRVFHVCSGGDLSLTGKGVVTTEGDIAVDSSVIRVGDGGSGSATLLVGEEVVIDAPGCYGVGAFGSTTEKVTINGTVRSTAPSNASYDGCAVTTLGTDTIPAEIALGKTAVISAVNTNAVYMPSGNLTVDGASVEGLTGIYVKSGKTIINGGAIKGTGAKKDYDYYGNGGISTGDAIVVDSCGYPNGAPAVEIKGGVFESSNALAVGAYKTEASQEGALAITGGTFSSDVSAHMPADYFEYAMHGGKTFIVQAKGAAAPANTSGYYWGDADANGVRSEVEIPYTPVNPTPTPEPTPEPTPAAPGTDVSGTDAAGNTVEATVIDNNKITLPDGTEAAGSVEFKGTTSSSGSSEPASEATIPSAVTANGSTYVVTKIADEAFEGQEQLTKVIIPETVVEIGSKAFANTALESVELPAATTVLGTGVFQGCDDLKTVDMAGSALTSIPDDAFKGCASLSSIAIPETVKTIGKRAFAETDLTSVELPAATTAIGASIFQGCDSLKTADISKAALTEIPAYAFNGTSITSIDIPDTVKTIGKRAFKKTNLKTVSTDAEVLERGAFSGCASLKTVNLPEVVEVGEYAFHKNDALKILTTGPDLEAIGPKTVKNAGKFKVLRISSKRLTKSSVEDSLKGSAVTRVEVAVAGSKKTQDKYVAKYRKIFEKANSGKSVEVTKAKKASKK